MTTPSQDTSEVRNARGEWRPPYPIRYAPIFPGPLRVVATLKWIVNYPGFMWPLNLLLLLISAGSWYLTQPAVARCVQFEAGWIAQVYVRNLGMMWLFYGAYYLHLYILKRRGHEGEIRPQLAGEHKD
jgi:hypothetical protein